eukprot:2850422-Amphidinium_carterae.1
MVPMLAMSCAVAACARILVRSRRTTSMLHFTELLTQMCIELIAHSSGPLTLHAAGQGTMLVCKLLQLILMRNDDGMLNAARFSQSELAGALSKAGVVTQIGRGIAGLPVSVGNTSISTAF